MQIKKTRENSGTFPNSKVDALIKTSTYVALRKNLLIKEVLTRQLQECISGNMRRKLKLLHMVKNFLIKYRTNTLIMKSDVKTYYI